MLVTLKLEIKYRNLTLTGIELTAVGWIIRRSGQKAKVAAKLCLPDGSVTAEYEAILIRPPKEVSDLWAPERDFWKVDAG